MATSGLLVLNSSTIGARDLWWQDDPDTEVVGYNVYRALDQPINWSKVNDELVPGHSFRDQTSLLEHTYIVQDNDWIEFGEYGRYGFHVPEKIIYSDVSAGRAFLATSPDDVLFTINGNPLRPAQVEGLDGTVWLPQLSVLKRDGGRTETKLGPALTKDLEYKIVYKTLKNFVDIYQDMTRTYYCIVPVNRIGQETMVPGSGEIVNTMEIDKMDYMQTEMVRRNAWLFEQVAEPAYLLFRRTKGLGCGCMDVDTKQPRSGCKVCYETGVQGGYYGPFDVLFIDPDTELSRTIDENGVKVERTSKSYLGPTPIVQNGDLIIRRNGERMSIGNVTYKSPRGVLLQQDFDVTLLPSKDTRYFIPLGTNPLPLPTIYNPVTNEIGTEPVTEPGSDWENPTKPVGRTVTFNRIQNL
jgi:hypothetical protein